MLDDDFFRITYCFRGWFNYITHLVALFACVLHVYSVSERVVLPRNRFRIKVCGIQGRGFKSDIHDDSTLVSS